MRLMLSKKLIQIVRTCASYLSTCQANNAAWHACMQHSISSLLCPPVQSAAYITSMALLLLCAYTCTALPFFVCVACFLHATLLTTFSTSRKLGVSLYAGVSRRSAMRNPNPVSQSLAYSPRHVFEIQLSQSSLTIFTVSLPL